MPRGPDPGGFFQAARVLFRLVHRQYRAIQTRWRRGEVPVRSPGFVVADGFATEAVDLRRSSLRRPWLYHIRSPIKEAVPEADVRGFSYAGAGIRYTRDQTLRAPEEAEQLVQDYAPDPHSGIRSTYLAFSYGAAIFTLGLAAWVRHAEPQAVRLLNGLILVQPAFLLNKAVATALQDEIDSHQGEGNDDLLEVPAALSHFLDMQDDAYRQRVEDETIEALRTLASAHGIRVFLLYWGGDQFLDFPPSLITRARHARVKVFQMSLSLAPGIKAFVAHCAVSGSDRVRKRIKPMVRSLWQ